MNVPVQKFWDATIETVYMSVVAFSIAIVIALLLGLFLYLSRKEGLYPKPLTYSMVSMVINFFRSTPFIILMLLLVPVTRLIIGTSIGTNAAIVALVAFGVPYIARLVEAAFLEIDPGVIELARSLGVTTPELVWKFLLPEAASPLIMNGTIAFVGIIGATAVAGTIGGGGLGDLAIQFGYSRYDYQTMFLAVGILIIFVQIVQSLGTLLARKARRL